MTFSVAVVLIVALAAIALCLVVYNLLGRLHLLETAVQGGMQAPSRRLSREDFERRFRVAQARAMLAAEIGTGIVLFVDSTSETSLETLATVRHLSRYDNLHLVACDDPTSAALTTDGIAHRIVTDLAHPLNTLGASTLPFLITVDDAKVRSSHHLGSTDALVDALRDFA